ncbi:MAG: TetR/AcrR family transcriptional regulator [candidate division Zixibacteria bacterium]|nr:TetR/AcrR family transcriptional regulator [candidate division Zixibacteria bacterium]NIW43267.1 TetR family transcriptional regulator [Gammaproteobacteria bacterium]NIX54400.1 TetR family transcriptional regulator [candidate division Zixibacteria bacterium]
MIKGQLTKEKIIEQAAVLFNRHGYAGASMSELMEVTGLKKGGIYNHFRSKEEILIKAFEHSVNIVRKKVQAAIQDKQTSREQLKGIIEFYRDYPMNPVVKGGCPILNSIVYADNTHTKFRESVRKAVDELIRVLAAIIGSGIRQGEFKKEIDPHKAAVVIFTAIEGGVATSRNYEDNRYMEMMIDHLQAYVDKELCA